MSRPEQDLTLVEIKYENSPLTFLTAVFACVSALTICWLAAMDNFIELKIPFCFTTEECNIADLTKALRIHNPDIAIVGSSLSKQLNPVYFSNTTVMDLSLPGGSVMTGLEILNITARLPKVILVEVNILDRPEDVDWTIKGRWAAESDLSAVIAGVTKPLRYLLSKPVFSHSVLSAAQQQAANRQWIAAVRSRDPMKYDIKTLVSVTRAQWDRRNGEDVARSNITRIRELTARLESRGAKVHFLYLPYSAGLDAHTYARRNREIASGNNAFDCEKCIDVRKLVDVRDLRWSDGAHMDGRSAAIVADSLERYLFQELWPVPALKIAH